MNILLSHGSPDAAHRQSVEELAQTVSAELGEAVGTAFLDDALPQGARVLPLLLGRGRHADTDVPDMIEAAGPELLTGPAEHPAAMADMAFELAQQKRGKQRAVMFAPYRLSAAQALVAELYERSKKFSLPAIAGVHGQCDAPSVLRLWAAEGLKEALIQPVLLFPGHSLQALKDAGAQSGLEVAIGATLCAHPGLAAWLAGRFREAV